MSGNNGDKNSVYASTPPETILNKPRDELELAKILSAKGVTQDSVALYLKEKEDSKETDTLVSAIQDLHFQIDLQIKLVSSLQETLRQKGLQYERVTSEIESLRKINLLLGELERSDCFSKHTEDTSEARLLRSPRSSKYIMMLNEKNRSLIDAATHDLMLLRKPINISTASNSRANPTDSAGSIMTSPGRRVGIADSPRRLLNCKSMGSLPESSQASSFDKIKSLIRPTK